MKRLENSVVATLVIVLLACAGCAGNPNVGKTDFTIRLICGFIFGIIATIVGIIFLIVCIVNKQSTFVPITVAFCIAGPIVSALCGFFLFRKDKKKEENEEAK